MLAGGAWARAAACGVFAAGVLQRGFTSARRFSLVYPLARAAAAFVVGALGATLWLAEAPARAVGAAISRLIAGINTSVAAAGPRRTQPASAGIDWG